MADIDIERAFEIAEMCVVFAEQQRKKAVVIKGQGDPSVIVFRNGLCLFLDLVSLQCDTK